MAVSRVSVLCLFLSVLGSVACVRRDVSRADRFRAEFMAKQAAAEAGARLSMEQERARAAAREAQWRSNLAERSEPSALGIER